MIPYIITTEGEQITGAPKQITTKGWDYQCSKEVGPTSAVIKPSFVEDDAVADEYWWEFEGQKVSNKDIKLLSLVPNSSYTPMFYIRHNGTTYSFETSFMTSELELTTLQPKCVSASCAIVAAQTNISDIEPMVGFQWKKYDAPSTLAPSEGYALFAME